MAPARAAAGGEGEHLGAAERKLLRELRAADVRVHSVCDSAPATGGTLLRVALASISRELSHPKEDQAFAEVFMRTFPQVPRPRASPVDTLRAAARAPGGSTS